jgi:hypothetical protein
LWWRSSSWSPSSGGRAAHLFETAASCQPVISQLRSRREPDRPILIERPARVIGDFPWVSIGIDEDGGVPAPKGLACFAGDRGSGRSCLLDHRVDLAGRGDVVSERHTTPPATVRHAAVLGELRTIPERDNEAVRLEEDDIGRGLCSRPPPKRLIERSRPRDVAYTQGDEGQPLIDTRMIPDGRALVRSAGRWVLNARLVP